ncbi:NACHT, LRR and PYD domains-containing protein 3-like isoform X1 [Alosa alosa]|nr:NACHT, LRR and PYD domains-containing protein 3-like isoform X1 [Alosa alosa]XP_048120892.1 NACHT, LRR and PYD domains-containing protein 3-like isoform X1 [Alosa alosa]
MPMCVCVCVRVFFVDIMDFDPDQKEKKGGVSQRSMSPCDSYRSRWTPKNAWLRSTLKMKFQHLVEGIPHQGETKLLHETYTELYITEGGGGEVNDEHEVRHIERASQIERAQGRPIKCSDIFKPLLEGDNRSKRWTAPFRYIKDIFKSTHRQHRPIRMVLTKGVAGIGKTVSVQKFILDWAEGKTNQDVHFIFPLPFRELNLMKEKEMCLRDLVQIFFPEIQSQEIFTNSRHRIMFIFDGLDECRLPLDFHSNPTCSDVTEPASVDVLMTNLIMGNLLPCALLWITTRPAAANQIPHGYVDQVTEIRGFNNLQKEEYFSKRIRDENLANRTIAHLKSSRSLYIMCHIPIFCWISSTVVERTSVESEKVEIPRTLTQVYTHFLVIQTSIKKDKYTDRKERDDEMILKLGKLAFQQLEKGNLIFYEEDLRECGIDITEASVYSGVCTQIFKEEAGLNQVKVFSFVHLSIQEFLAALYVFLCFNNREGNMPDQQQTSQLCTLFRATTLHDLHKAAVDLALQSENGHLDLFLRFLLGLSLESNQNILRHLHLLTRSQSQSSEQTVQYIKQKIRDQNNSYRRINLFYCLNELNNHAVVEYTDRSSESLSVVMLLPGEWKIRKFEFKMSEEQLDKFDLQKYIKTPEEDLTELLSPDEVLKKLLPVVAASTSVMLMSCSLTGTICDALASAASLTSWSLKELFLSGNQLHDVGAQYLSDLIINPHCKLEKLVLERCSLTEKSCAALASAASTSSCSLKYLSLSENNISDAGVQYFSDLLNNHHCKLQKLVLFRCFLTEKSCAALASAGRSTPCSLKELNLSHNELHDAGIQHISDLLKNPYCNLENLVLGNCSLTEKSCAHLASAASSAFCSLKEVNLGSNELHDAGVQHLSDLLRNPHCKWEKLVLSGCSLTEKSCAGLASAASSVSCSLKELNLSDNDLHDAGVQHLSDLLKSPHCKLEKLILGACSLTDESCLALASAANSTSCSLKELILGKNDILDAGVQNLSDLLRNPHCKLEKLELNWCSLTEKSCATLALGASPACSSLKWLNLSDNDIHDAGVQHLSDLLRNPHCKLQKLVLCRCSLTEKSCEALASAASSTSCSLKELNLSDNKFHDAGVQHLSDLLKNPNCSLKKLLVDVRIFIKETPAPASTSCSQSSDAADLHLRDKTQQDPGVELLSVDTPKQRWSCHSCAHITDPAHWTLVTPSISMENGLCVYNINSPAGSHECSESGLRWACAGPVALQYHFSKDELFWAQLQMLGYQPAGPLMDIKLLSGELEEVHLPHSLCLGGSDPSVLGGAVRSLHSDDSDSGVSLETCELSRFHGKLLGRRFSLWQLVVNLGIPVKTHCEVLIYQSCPQPLILNAFLVPAPSTARQLVEERWKSRGALSICKPPPDDSLWVSSRFQLWTSCSSVITPSAMTLSYNTSPTFFEVCLENPPKNFNMELRPTERKQSVWTAVMWQGADYLQTRNHADLTEPSDAHKGLRTSQNVASSVYLNQVQRDMNIATNTQEAAVFVDRHRAELIARVGNVMPIADVLLSKGLVHPERYSEIRAAATSEAKMREIYECLRSAGAEGKAAFYGVLLQEEPHLLQDLRTPAL